LAYTVMPPTQPITDASDHHNPDTID
jgi:hypothetical protein